jgi:hypothetical protein
VVVLILKSMALCGGPVPPDRTLFSTGGGIPYGPAIQWVFEYVVEEEFVKAASTRSRLWREAAAVQRRLYCIDTHVSGDSEYDSGSLWSNIPPLDIKKRRMILPCYGASTPLLKSGKGGYYEERLGAASAGRPTLEEEAKDAAQHALHEAFMTKRNQRLILNAFHRWNHYNSRMSIPNQEGNAEGGVVGSAAVRHAAHFKSPRFSFD